MHILTSNSMVSHAMWKNTREFLNTSKCTRSLNSCNFDRLWITHSCILFPDCTRNHTNAYTNNYRVYQKRRPLEIKHIVKIWMPFQLHICWTVVREILMGCIRVSQKKWHYRNYLIVLKPLLNARDYTPGNLMYLYLHLSILKRFRFVQIF